ncbi:MAG: hypothetical protein K2X03_08440 [Bryobacteraceae bacterium]|nr:hypothetical protein [Bryobacteraceae bacterium]
MSVAASAEQEIVDFIAAGTTPTAIIHFRPSAEAILRLEDLIDREKEGALSDDEKLELDHCMHLEHLMRMAKAKARLILSGA